MHTIEHLFSWWQRTEGRGEHFEVAVAVGEATNQLLSGQHHADPRVSAVAQLTASNFKSGMLSRSTISQKGFRKKIVGGQEGKTFRFHAGTGACQEAPSNFSKPSICSRTEKSDTSQKNKPRVNSRLTSSQADGALAIGKATDKGRQVPGHTRA